MKLSGGRHYRKTWLYVVPAHLREPSARRFAEEWAHWLVGWLPAGSRVAEYMPGPGWASWALVRTGLYEVALIADSEDDLRDARRLLTREGLVADFVVDDDGVSVHPHFDLVFTTLALWEFPSRERVALLRSMAQRSRQYVLVLVPNPGCYWYWLWRVSQAADGQPGVTVEEGGDTVVSMGQAFQAAGLTYIGRRYGGAEWVEALIGSIRGIETSTQNLIRALHRSPLASPEIRHPWMALLGSVSPRIGTPEGWEDRVNPTDDAIGLYWALAGSLARSLAAERRLRRYCQKLGRLDREYQRYREDKELHIATLRHEVEDLETRLHSITTSTGWALLEVLWKIRLKLAPRGSFRERVLRSGLRSVRALARGLRRWVFGWSRLAIFQDAYTIEDNSRVVLYTERTDLYPDYHPRRSLAEPPQRRVSVTLVATVKDERDVVDAWFQSVMEQTRPPDEVVIVDGGSTDGTYERLQDWSTRLPCPCIILREAGANIARGRNLAIARARSEVIAVSDLGCRLRPDWLERLMAPFERDALVQVVAGWYEAVDRDGRAFRRRRWPTLARVRPDSFIPSSRSLAFTRSAWEAVGGYPEWLTLTGEDTYFALELKKYCRHWAFVPEAVVEWYAPDRRRTYWKKVYQWSQGDGESGVLAHTYARSVARVVLGGAIGAIGLGALLVGMAHGGVGWFALGGAGLVALVGILGRYGLGLSDLVWEMGAEVARILGFWQGFRRRALVTRRRMEALRGLIFVLSGVPIDDTGGGARCTQMTLELLRQGYAVIFIHRFPKYESVELDLRIRHPNLQVYSWQDFSIQEFLKSSGDLLTRKPSAAIVEFPVAEFLPLIESLRAHGTAVVYDLLDDWNTALGASWYRPSIERQIVERADVLVATAPSLQERLEQMAGRPVTLLPNAVNHRLFDRHRTYIRPEDMPEAAWTVIYVGALWGSWFDWDLLREVARTYPEAAVVVIGDYRGQLRRPPPNLHFLGLKPQRDLPAYLAHADVAIIPWKVDAITRATSPLKVYEYVAMGKPVVAPDLPTLRDIPLVLLSQDAWDFVDNVQKARQIAVPDAELEAFLRAHTWTSRIEALLRLLAECETWRSKAHGCHLQPDARGRHPAGGSD